MAKNISKNQWFKDIANNVYLYTAVINDLLIVVARSTKLIKSDTVIAKLRNPDLVNFCNKNLTFPGTTSILLEQDGNLRIAADITLSSPTVIIPLKSKQLETDFYTKEQLAEMYPDDPAYQPAVVDESKPVAVSNEEESES